jgi:hypothetical protein
MKITTETETGVRITETTVTIVVATTEILTIINTTMIARARVT